MSKGAKDIDIVVLDSGEPEIRQVSAKNPLQAYKSAVKSFCPPETGGSNILKKEKDLTKDVLPMLYKAFTFKASPSEFHGNALGFVMSQTPELATLTLKKYTDKDTYLAGFDVGDEVLGSQVIWRVLTKLDGNIDDKMSGNTEEERVLFLRELEKSIVSDIGEKRYTALVKSTQSLIKSIVFYFRFVNQPQLLVCDDGDYVKVISNFIGAGAGAQHVDEDGKVRIDKFGMLRTVEPYGLLPVPVYSRSVFKAQPDKEARFLRVFGVSALKMGYTTIDDMPKLRDQLAITEVPLAKEVEKVLEEREDEIALLETDVYDDAAWLDIISFTDDAIAKYNEEYGTGRFEEDFADAKKYSDLQQIDLTQETLRLFVKNGWTPKTPITYNRDRWNNDGLFKWEVYVSYDRKLLQEQTIEKLLAIRNLTENFDGLYYQVRKLKELEAGGKELVFRDVVEAEIKGRMEEERRADSEPRDTYIKNDFSNLAIREELEGVKEELEEAQSAVRELEEEVDTLENKGNDYDILEQVLDRLGVNVKKVIEEATEQGTDSFVNSSEFNDLVIERVERSLFN